MQACSQPAAPRACPTSLPAVGARTLTIRKAQGQASTTTTSSQPSYSPFSSRPGARDGYLQREPIPIVVVPMPERAPPPLPKPVPIIHSSAYLQQTLQERANGDDSAAKVTLEKTGTQLLRRTPRPRAYSSSDQEAPSGTALEVALRRADESLDELEANPHPIQQVVYGISRGPVGVATTNAVQAAAKLTVQATVQAAKVAAPIGRWALAEGAKAAAKLIQTAVVEGVKAESRRATQVIKKGDASNKQKR